jgi:hypothetical protein
MAEERTAIERLRAAIERLDSYGAPPDDRQVYIDDDNCLFELVPDEQVGTAPITLFDLRCLLVEVNNLMEG